MGKAEAWVLRLFALGDLLVPQSELLRFSGEKLHRLLTRLAKLNFAAFEFSAPQLLKYAGQPIRLNPSARFCVIGHGELLTMWGAPTLCRKTAKQA
jgi:hypothetical protein